MLFLRIILIRFACANQIQTFSLIFMQKIITSVYTVDNRYLIIWGCFTNVKAHKKQWYALKCESSTNNTESSNMTSKIFSNPGTEDISHAGWYLFNLIFKLFKNYLRYMSILFYNIPIHVVQWPVSAPENVWLRQSPLLSPPSRLQFINQKTGTKRHTCNR
jgi:hypothetical protein